MAVDPHPQPPIPYAGARGESMRVLDLVTRRGLVSGPSVQVTIDGAAYPSSWGRSRFEIPADRPVSVSVHQPARGTSGVAGLVLSPEQPAVLEYRGPAHLSRPGALGAPGTVKQHGLGLQVPLLGCLALLLLLLVGFVVWILASSLS